MVGALRTQELQPRSGRLQNKLPGVVLRLLSGIHNKENTSTDNNKRFGRKHRGATTRETSRKQDSGEVCFRKQHHRHQIEQEPGAADKNR
jgi:hypothetical protein